MSLKQPDISQLGVLFREAGIEHWNTIKIQDVDEKYWIFFTQWRQKHYHAEMHWIEKNDDLRRYPEKLHPGTKTIICFLVPYFQLLPSSFTQRFSIYITSNDYHKVIKKRVKPILSFLKSEKPIFKPRAFVDSAPIPERFWAWKAGLGFIGKNGMLIHPDQGSYFFIGCIFTDHEFDKINYSIIETPCGNCSKCIDACPTGAIVTSAGIDSRLCISYHTIESKNNIPAEIQDKNPSYIAGCDICQQVCPYNKKPVITREPEFFYSAEEILEFGNMDNIMGNPVNFKNIFGRSAAMRAGYDKISNLYHEFQNNVK